MKKPILKGAYSNYQCNRSSWF